MKELTYEHVSKTVSNMLSQNIKPSIRNVISVTGGRTEKVSAYIKDFLNKRDAEVSQMASELGSSKIAGLLANEIQLVVDSKTATLTEIVDRQKSQISEFVELLNEKETECQHRIELAESQNIETVNEITKKLKETTEQAAIAEAVKEKAEIKVTSIQQKTQILIGAANQQVTKAESETVELREQVKLLTVDTAKNEIKQTQYEQTQKQLEILQLENADQKILIVQLQTEKKAFTKDISRLEGDLNTSKIKTEKFNQVQTQLIEEQKKTSQLQHDLSQSQRERESLSQALAVR